MDTISFCTPCLRWKFALFSKAQFGFNGFIAPFRRKYLRVEIHARADFYSPAGTILFSTSAAATDTIDRITGGITHLGDSLPLSAALGLAHPEFVIDDVTARQVVGTPGPNAVVSTTDWALSNEYTVGQLEADVDAQIAGFNPDSLGWFKLTSNVSPDVDYPPFPDGDVLDRRLPTNVVYAPLPALQVLDVAELRAASWYVFEPSDITGFFTPNIGGGFLGYFLKLVGWFGMNGKYCEKTFYVDPAAEPVGTVGCVSGQAGCGASFRVDPPPFVEGKNGYKLIVPNCQCA
jgi:hypothetical protein